MISVTVGVPYDVLVGARNFPSHLVTGGSLLRRDRRPPAELAHRHSDAVTLERGARPCADAVEEVIVADLYQASRAKCFNYCPRDTDCAVAIQVLMEARLESFQGRAAARHDGAIGKMIAVA